MLKRIISISIVLAVLLALIPVVPASAATEGIYTYTVSVFNGEATITACQTSASGDITIPSTLGGYPVAELH
ncbi:MAG: hypothetical protein M0R40_00245 [Firmicutes bacterium]|nr:hypothetical protein [Bacillota bacterium]